MLGEGAYRNHLKAPPSWGNGLGSDRCVQMSQLVQWGAKHCCKPPATLTPTAGRMIMHVIIYLERQKQRAKQMFRAGTKNKPLESVGPWPGQCHLSFDTEAEGKKGHRHSIFEQALPKAKNVQKMSRIGTQWAVILLRENILFASLVRHDLNVDTMLSNIFT